MKTFTEVYEFMMSIMGNVPYGVISIDMEGFITMINEQALDNLNIQNKPQKLLDTFLLDHLEKDFVLYPTIKSCLKKSRKPFDFEEMLFHSKYITVNGRAILNGMIITTIDVTEIKESRLLATQSLLEGQETERKRLAQEIHDGLGPLLSTIRLNVESINSKENLDIETHQRLGRVETLVKEVTQDMRDISHALMPSAIVDFGLVTALENLCKKANESENVQINFFTKNIEGRLNEQVELGLFRISQELLNNALKYSKAENIHVQLIQRKDDLVLTMEDDGVGFDLKKTLERTDKGIGLRNIETRVQLLNGNYDIETSPDNGVFTTVEIPL
ncbi:MAG: ATP-binding protein [Saprospiraceae bacterium]